MNKPSPGKVGIKQSPMQKRVINSYLFIFLHFTGCTTRRRRKRCFNITTKSSSF